MEIEQLATSALIQAISKTDYLQPFINSGDKEPSWDGSIYAYDKQSKAKSNLLGRVHVQVKGKKSKIKSGNIKYSVEVSDLRNYLNEGGTIYFVIYVDDNCDTKIFYNSLLPYDLKVLFNKVKNKTAKNPTITITLYPFPKRKTEIESIFYDFITHRKMQGVLINSDIQKIDEVLKSNEYKDLIVPHTFVSTGNQENHNFQFLFEGRSYLYAKSSLGITIPLFKIEGEISVSREVECIVSCNGRIFYNVLTISNTKNSVQLLLGKSTTLALSDNRAKFTYNITGNLSERLFDAEFIYNAISEGEFEIDGNKYSINNDERLAELDTITEIFKSLQKLDFVFKHFGVIGEIDFNSVTNNDIHVVSRLYEAIFAGAAIDLNFNEKFGSKCFIQIANINILMCVTGSEHDGKYFVKNLFDIDVIIRFESGKTVETSAYVILKADDILTASNINYQNILEALKLPAPTEEHLEKSNLLLLEMLQAYDNRTINKEELLASCKEVAKWLHNECNNIIYKINYYQTYKREKPLDRIQLIDLEKDLCNDKLDTMLKAAICILLENYYIAGKYYNELSLEDKAAFLAFPISNLWPRDIDTDILEYNYSD